MSRRQVTAALVALPAFALPLLAPASASAQPRDVELFVDQAAWSWRPIVPAAAPEQEPSNVPTGDLAVSYDGRPDAPPAKATYLRLALGDLPRGTTATSLTVALNLDPAVSQDASTAPLVACTLTAAFVPGSGVEPEQMPGEDCTGAPKGTYDAASQTVRFILTDAASAWLSGKANNGFVVRPDPAAALPTVTPFDLTFSGPGTVQALLALELPVGPVMAPVPGAVAAPTYTPPVYPAPSVFPQLGPQTLQQPVAQAPSLPVTVVPAVPATVPVAAPQALSVPGFRAPARDSLAGLGVAGALAVLLLLALSWASGQAADPMMLARAERVRRDRLRVLPAAAPAAQARQIRQARRPLSSATSTVT